MHHQFVTNNTKITIQSVSGLYSWMSLLYRRKYPKRISLYVYLYFSGKGHEKKSEKKKKNESDELLNTSSELNNSPANSESRVTIDVSYIRNSTPDSDERDKSKESVTSEMPINYEKRKKFKETVEFFEISDKIEKPANAENLERPAIPGRFERPDIPERLKRPEKRQRLEGFNIPNRFERPAIPENLDATERFEKFETLNRPESFERPGNIEKNQYLEKHETLNRPESPQTSEHIEKYEHFEKPQNVKQRSTPEKFEKSENREYRSTRMKSKNEDRSVDKQKRAHRRMWIVYGL